MTKIKRSLLVALLIVATFFAGRSNATVCEWVDVITNPIQTFLKRYKFDVELYKSYKEQLANKLDFPGTPPVNREQFLAWNITAINRNMGMPIAETERLLLTDNTKLTYPEILKKQKMIAFARKVSESPFFSMEFQFRHFLIWRDQPARIKDAYRFVDFLMQLNMYGIEKIPLSREMREQLESGLMTIATRQALIEGTLKYNLKQFFIEMGLAKPGEISDPTLQKTWLNTAKSYKTMAGNIAAISVQIAISTFLTYKIGFSWWFLIPGGLPGVSAVKQLGIQEAFNAELEKNGFESALKFAFDTLEKDKNISSALGTLRPEQRYWSRVIALNFARKAYAITMTGFFSYMLAFEVYPTIARAYEFASVTTEQKASMQAKMELNDIKKDLLQRDLDSYNFFNERPSDEALSLAIELTQQLQTKTASQILAENSDRIAQIPKAKDFIEMYVEKFAYLLTATDEQVRVNYRP